MKRRWRPVAVVTAMVVSVVVPTAAEARPARVAPGGRDGVVTLVTGDRVTVVGGTPQVRGGQGREGVGFSVRRDARGHLNVVPLDVLDAVADGRLDPRLFDVDGLIEARYDDLSSDVTPLIVTGGAVGASAGRALPSVDGYAVAAPKSAGFVTASATAKVWLDGPVRAALDRSVPQVGAPEAWRAGHTGQGALVAVLDTGVDATHPDLAGAIVASRDFSGSIDTDDRIGHGTHVAATITGSGRYQGVAPDAKLLVGKVLNDGGGGRESDVIAGMEWAAAEHADVVNLSLGSDRPTDGTDPMSAAVNRLSAETGTLFVVAAGNSGPTTGTIGSPAAADAALTVGAVDRNDALAEFSSRGPRHGDEAVKPEITAPGVAIAAAKAAGGFLGDPVDATHVSMSGTSMATPHVAGAAAILAARHPDWDAAKLKAALVGSARPNPANTADEQGAGRLDVARADRTPASSAPAALAFGVARWPHADDTPITRTLRYRNDGTAPLSLALTADVRGPAGGAPGLITFAPDHLTVPPGGVGEVTATATTSSALPDGRYSGAVVATGGDAVVRTPFAVTKEVESYDVVLRGLDRAGAPTARFRPDLVDLARERDFGPDALSEVVTLRVPRGTYLLSGTVVTDAGATFFAEPAFTVTGDTSYVLDARRGKEIRFHTDHPEAAAGVAQAILDVTTDWGVVQTGYGGLTFSGFDFAPSTTSGGARAVFRVLGKYAKPDGTGGFLGTPYLYTLDREVTGGYPKSPEWTFRDRDLSRITEPTAASGAAPYGARDDFAVNPLPGTITEFRVPGSRWPGLLLEVASPTVRQPVALQVDALGRTYPRRATERWNVAPFGPAFPTARRVDYWAGRTGDEIQVGVPTFSEQSPTRYGFSETTSARTVLRREGVVVSDAPSSGSAYGTVPPGDAAFTLHVEANREAAVSTSVTADWTFRSAHRAEVTPLPLLAVRFAPVLDEHNRAAAGRAFTFPVYVQRNGTEAVTGVRTSVWASYDEGRTWKAVPLVKVGQRWVASVRHPAGAKSVSLKAKASDRDGNTVEQTIIRAYGLK
ncbi:S8 family serine peptidase [Actinosynnema sp. NPDC020468]|uniref:S8 family serine peptidase n=1 Tax=Actinosynnema sp. NPDC020468 TaxID=3154488 RepID=UPI0033DA10EA